MERSSFNSKICSLIKVLIFGILMFLVMSTKAEAAVQNASPKAQISFTFDDGLLNSLTEAAPVLAKYGYSGTSYVTGNCVEMIGFCDHNPGEVHMNWSELRTLRDVYGWEIAAHSMSHPLMTNITAANADYEAAAAKALLEQHGFTPTAFATPYGDYSDDVLAILAKYYTSHRGFADRGYNTWPYQDYVLRVQQVQSGVSISQVKSYIDKAKADNVWLILVFHNISTVLTGNPDYYEYSTSDLDSIAAYVSSSSIPVVNVSQGLVSSTTNLLGDPASNNGTLSQGWQTNDPLRVVVDNGNNGSTPSPQNSIKMTASVDQNAYLFSPQVSINPNDLYVIKAYVSVVDNFNTGEVALYVDEYNSQGSWISGQYRDAIRTSIDKDISITYQATSLNVSSASLQIIVTSGSGISAYVDNIRWFSTTGLIVNPPVPLNNLMANSEFDQGIALGWQATNPTVFSADFNGNGSQIGSINSVKFNAGSTNAYLYSPMIEINDPEINYTIKAYTDIDSIQSGEYAFYIDEYDNTNKWISGQYKTISNNIGIYNIEYQYKPSNSNVIKAQLQIIIPGNSGINGYVDSVQWLAPISSGILKPENINAPIITGVNQNGQTLLLSNGDWANQPDTYTYKWQRCTLQLYCVDINGATSNSYLVTVNDVGYFLRANVKASNSKGLSDAYSLLTEQIVSAPSNSGLPVISGETVQGNQINSTAGTWLFAPTSLTYQWQRCSGQDCTNISNAVSPTYTLLAVDVGKTIRVIVTATNSYGQTSAASMLTAVITRPTSKPINIAVPIISGTPTVSSIITTTNGEWSNYPTSYRYQWQRCISLTCTNISGATSITYILTNSDIGYGIRAIVRARNNIGTTTAYSLKSQIISMTIADNLLSNSQFIQGLSLGWNTDNSSQISWDTASNGSPGEPVNSIKLVSPVLGVKNAHLFSQKVNITKATYNIDFYIKLATINSGSVGFYIDEYDSAGQWISGQYVASAVSIGGYRLQTNYIPSSANVTNASFQVILPAGSGIVAYIDDVIWR